MSEVIITVRGEHEAKIAPERGVASISVVVEGPDRGRVVEQVAALAAPIRDDLTARREAGGVEEWASHRVAVWSNRPWNNEGKQLALVHHASVEFSATFTDFAALSWWISTVAEREGVQVGGVSWRLTPETLAEIERDVAARAVHVAVTRATAYAEAIGRASVFPVEIADLGLLTHGDAPSGGSPKMMRAMAMDSSIGGGPAIEFQPEDIVITAAVEARFVAS